MRDAGLPRDRLGLSLEDWILAVLAYAGGRLRGRTRIHKALFLVKYDADYGLVPADFRPYRYGPYSDEVTETLRRLEERGLIRSMQVPGGEVPAVEYSLTGTGLERGEKALEVLKSSPQWPAIREILDFATKAPMISLLNYVYMFYPEFAKQSEIRHRLRLRA